MRTLAISLITSLVLLITGCASIRHYEGPALPSTDIAIILEGKSFSIGSKRGGFFVSQLKSGGNTQFKDMGNRSEVLPGEVHFTFLVVRFYQPFGKQYVKSSLKFVAEAGKKYVVHGWSGPKPGVWVLDINTGTVVGRTGEIPENTIAESKQSLLYYQRQ